MPAGLCNTSIVTLMCFMVICVSYGREFHCLCGICPESELVQIMFTGINQDPNQNKTDDTARHVMCVLLQWLGVSVNDNVLSNQTHYRASPDRSLACPSSAVITFAETLNRVQCRLIECLSIYLSTCL